MLEARRSTVISEFEDQFGLLRGLSIDTSRYKCSRSGPVECTFISADLAVKVTVTTGDDF